MSCSPTAASKPLSTLLSKDRCISNVHSAGVFSRAQQRQQDSSGCPKEGSLPFRYSFPGVTHPLTALVKLGLTRIHELLNCWRHARCWEVFCHLSSTPAVASHTTFSSLQNSSSEAKQSQEQLSGSASSPLGLSETSGRTCGDPRLKGGSHHCEVGMSHYDVRPCHRGAAATLPGHCPGGTP